MKTKNQIKSFAAFFILFFALSANVLASSIVGRVTDRKTGKPLSNVNIYLQGTLIGTTTDVNGRFRLTNIPKGRRILVFSYLGYKTYRMKIKLRKKKLQHFEIALLPRPIDLGEAVVVTAAKTGLSDFDSSVPMAILSARELQAASVQNISDALVELPSISMAGQAYHRSPSIRGLARKRVVVLVDGEKISSERNVGPPGTFVNPEDIERIEVLRGPYSTLYGSDAIGGVINIITRSYVDPTHFRWAGGSISTSYNAVNNGKNGYMEFNSHLGRFYLHLNGGIRKADNYVDALGREIQNTFYNERDIGTCFAFRPNGNQNLELRWRLSDGRNIGKPAYDVLTNAVHDRDIHRQLGIKYEWKNVIAGIPKILFNISRHDHDLGVVIHKHKVETDPSDDKLIDNIKNIFGQDYNLRSEIRLLLSRELSVLTGFNGYFRENIRMDGHKVVRNYQTRLFIKEERENLIPKAFQRNYGFFTQGDFIASPRWAINGGIRIDLIHTGEYPLNGDKIFLKNQAISGSAGITYRPRKWIHYSANIGRAFRAPDIKELFVTTQTPGGLNIGNIGLQPEHSLNLDFSVKTHWETAGFSFSLFRNQIYHMIILDWNNRTANRVGTFKNIGEGLLYGAEFAGHINFFRNWYIAGNISQIYGYDIHAHEVLMDVPPLQVNFWVKRFFYERKFWTALSVRYSGKQTKVAEDDFPNRAFTLFNFQSGWKIKRFAQLHFSITNLFNQNYREHYQFEWMRGPGRSVNGGISIVF